MSSRFYTTMVFLLVLIQGLIILNPATALAESETDNSILFDSRTISGYHNFTEVVQILGNIQTDYPGIAKVYDLSSRYPHFNNTPKKTRFNNSIYALKISDNVNEIETDEPAVLYVGLHHAREWISVEVCLYMANHLTKYYNTNATVKSMVDNNEIWILPVLNPDGYIYSHEMDDINRSSGSGGWRKNRVETNSIPGFQDNGGGNGDGVDLNRNYGYRWGYDNSGSDPSPSGVTYRGPSAFSEVETQIMRDFALEMEFSTAVSFHSHSEIIIVPWAYADADTAHHKVFMEMGKEMGKYNGYPHGNSKSGLIYNANGEWGDWMYNALECLAFTYEIGTVFIHPENTILPFCQKNAEAAFVAAKYAGNPLALFESNLQGTVKDTKGNPIEGAVVSTNFINYSVSSTTNSAGEYFLRLPDGSYDVAVYKDGYEEKNKLNANVPKGGKGTLDIVLKDKIPPRISSVNAAHVLGGTETYTIFNATEEVVIIVRDSANETDLSGYVIINSTSQSYLSNPIELSFSLMLGYYYAYWPTENLNQAYDYRVDAVLTDYDGNSDFDGSNDSGPDLTLTLLDKTPPIISKVRSSAGSDIGGIYEIGTTIKIEVYEEFHETDLTGTVEIFDPNSYYSSGIQELVYNPALKHYYWTWETTDLRPSSNYFVETTLTDKWGNIDSDGLPAYPDTILTLRDTTAPVIVNVDSNVLSNSNEEYEKDSIVTIRVYESRNESDLDGIVTIQSPDLDDIEPVNLELNYEPDAGYYYTSWDTTSAVPYVDYYIDSRLEDDYGNGDYDGSNNFGPDLVIRLTDTKAPEIKDVYAVSDYTQQKTAGGFEIGEVIRIIVEPNDFEPELSGSVCIYSPSIMDNPEILPINFDPVRMHYYSIWESAGLIPGDYNIDANLSDKYGNIDTDGLYPQKPDVIIELVDTTPPQVTDIRVGYPGQPSVQLQAIEIGCTARIEIMILNNEQDLSGILRISSDTNNYLSGDIPTFYDKSTRTYVVFWNTSGQKPGDDFELEAIFSDPYGNFDSDGLKPGADRILILEDTTPPPAAENLFIIEDTEEKGSIKLSWDIKESNSTAAIYRSDNAINSKADAELIITTDPGTTNYVDKVDRNGKTYYYLILITDENGNINETVTPGNTGSVTVSKKDSSNKFGALMITASITAVVLIMFVVVFFFMRNKKIEAQNSENKNNKIKNNSNFDTESETSIEKDLYKDDY